MNIRLAQKLPVISRNKPRSMSLQNLPSPPPTLKSPPLLQPVFHPDLPSDPKKWSSTHVATYLSHCLRMYPPAIVSDLSRHVKENVTLTGRKFLRLKEEQLRQMNFNEKWIKLIMVGVKNLRRDHLKDKILLNGSDINGMKISEEFSEESDEEQYPSLTRNSSYSSATMSSTSSFLNNDQKDFFIPTFSSLTSDDKKFISQEFNRLKEFLKSDIEKEDNNNTSFKELNRIIEKAITNIEVNQEDRISEVDEEKSKPKNSLERTNDWFWEKIESGFAQGIMIGGVAVWAFMKYSKP
ncbi:hypothetical protein GLOIN_2v1500221 [Rhizophagus clarus]|uniref:SAM domain-containing protein n=1 Tax=Rhizophagus clarus TaxID=94130 RepID=A0A8H3LY47_9GLOM|nr:hypothetical protein GLOIN_2v1500221 [Rhizophagus clarus]